VTPFAAVVRNTAQLMNVRGDMWSRRVAVIDLVAIVPTGLLALVTAWYGSAPVMGGGGFFLLTMAWAMVAIAWSLTLLASVTDEISRGAALLLVIGSVVILVPGPLLLLLIVAGPYGVLVGLAVAVGLFGTVVYRSPARRIGWLVAPAIVAVTLVALVSGVPRLVRMAYAEPHLTAYAQAYARDHGLEPSADWDYIQMEIGSIPVDAVFIEGGYVHLVTDYVGLMDDVGAGLAYVPGGAGNPRYQHIVGDWYRWLGSGTWD
jgi:hypothetical protein